MSWLLLVALAWVALALPVALVVGRVLRVADRVGETAGGHVVVPDHVPAEWVRASSV